MSTADSNQQPQQAAKPAAPQALVQPPAVKSFTQRFAEMEEMYMKLAYVVNFHTNGMEQMMSRLDRMVEDMKQMRMVRKSVNAMMKLSEEGKVLSLENVARKISDLEKEAAKEQLAEDLKNNIVAVAATVQNDTDLIEFETGSDKDYGLISVRMLEEGVRKAIVGKKVGDEVEGMSILGIYAYVAKKSEEGSNEQATKS